MPRTISFEWKGRNVTLKIDGELELSNLSTVEAREAVSKAVGQYAYYGALKADAKKMQQQIEAAFEFWYSMKYRLIDEDERYTKKTEAWKKNHVIVSYQREWKEHKAKVIKINNIVEKLRVICDSYEYQMRVLQSVLSTLRTELELTAIDEGQTVRGRNRYSYTE